MINISRVDVGVMCYNDIENVLSKDLKEKINKLVETKDRYVASIESNLRIFGETALAEELLEEVEILRNDTSIRISKYNRLRLINNKQVRQDGSIETFDDVINRKLGKN